MKFLLKYPSRSRPALFKASIDAWTRTASGEHQLQWLISADLDDETMNNPEIRNWCAERDVPIHFGNSRTKVEAINADMDKAGDDWDVLINVSDDMIPNEGWDKIIAEHMPDDLNAALWFPDGIQRRLCTLSVFGRPVFDLLGGCIYHPAFVSVYCDNYYHWLMEQHGLLKRVDIPIARHAWREQNNDALMKRNEDRATYNRDRQTLQRLVLETNALAK